MEPKASSLCSYAASTPPQRTAKQMSTPDSIWARAASFAYGGSNQLPM
jgi:hypothetical protein